MSLDALLIATLLYVLLPVWLAAGAADWWCHRRTRIETTAGTFESALHILLFAQVAIPVMAGLYLRINALMLAAFGLAVLAHLACSLWDTWFSQPRRCISPIEQHIHAFLDLIPAFAFVLVVCLQWQEIQFREWQFTPREFPVATGVILSVVGGLAAGFLLILEEYVRCARAPRQRADIGHVRIAG